jgi:LmbE family N-acetylglucosaminyl deacetylase
MTKTVLIFCAHNDDQIIGAGGTLINYVKKGMAFKTIIFAFGRSSHPHLKEDVIVKTRVEESLRSDNIMGGSGIAYLGLKEGKFPPEFKSKRIKEKIKWIIEKEKPVMVFTHSVDDPHPDHRAVHNLIKDIVEELPFHVPTYTFDVWNIWSVKRHQQPKMVVDITNSFQTKIKALEMHKSQKAAVWTLGWNIYLRAMTSGWDYGYKYAEVFYRIN